MTSNIQKKREKNYALQMSVALGDSWQVEFPPDEAEWPDLIVHDAENNSFGLEVREITKDKEFRQGSKLRAKEGKNIKIIQELAERYYQCSNIPIKVGVLGALECQSELVNKLVAFTESNREWTYDRIEIGVDTVLHVTILPSEVGKYTRWAQVNDRVGWVKKIGVSDLSPVVAKKEQNLDKYRSHINDVRLMLVADPTFSSGMVSWIEDSGVLNSKFDEVYLFVCPNKVHRINS